MGNSPVTGEFPAQRASNAENVSIWWRHHDTGRKGAEIEVVERQQAETPGAPFTNMEYLNATKDK